VENQATDEPVRFGTKVPGAEGGMSSGHFVARSSGSLCRSERNNVTHYAVGRGGYFLRKTAETSMAPPNKTKNVTAIASLTLTFVSPWPAR
jgi:hypothetical protein